MVDIWMVETETIIKLYEWSNRRLGQEDKRQGQGQHERKRAIGVWLRWSNTSHDTCAQE